MLTRCRDSKDYTTNRHKVGLFIVHTVDTSPIFISVKRKDGRLKKEGGGGETNEKRIWGTFERDMFEFVVLMTPSLRQYGSSASSI